MNLLLNLVKEPGIEKIILDYKSDIERTEKYDKLMNQLKSTIFYHSKHNSKYSSRLKVIYTGKRLYRKLTIYDGSTKNILRTHISYKYPGDTQFQKELFIQDKPQYKIHSRINPLII